MIGQQLYTRERRGLFRNSEGYDSIAKSPGLSDAFIKENVHPFCVYNPPKALQVYGVPPEDYPKAQTVVHFPDGSVLLGQAAYVPADFTGQRPAFFAHHYILPPEEARTLDVIQALRETEFLTEYDIACGKELPALSALPPKIDKPECLNEAAGNAGFNDEIKGEGTAGTADERPTVIKNWDENPGDPAIQILERLGITREKFKKIIYFLLLSASGTKKTYIVTPVPAPETPSYARALLGALFPYLPSVLQGCLGFCTYSREPENKKGLHLIFLDKDALRLGDPRTARDFVLDIGRNQFYKPETNPEKSAYLSFLYNCVKQAEGSEAYTPHLTQAVENEAILLDCFASQFPESLSLPQWDDITLLYFASRDVNYIDDLNTEEMKQLYFTARRYLPLTRYDSEDYLDLRLFAVSLILESAERPDIDVNEIINAFARTLDRAGLIEELQFWVENSPITA
jgi:hypothetical protein